LAEPLLAPAGYALCRPCRLAPPPFVRAVAYGPYQDRMKSAIHALKYDHLHPAARGLGQMLAQAIAQLALEAPSEMLVIPVPLHRSKYAQRGFNQARALALYALAALRKTHPKWRLTLASQTLMRLRATESQAGLTFRQRRLNVRGAFTVSDPAFVANKHVLLIDDIFTTGATRRLPCGWPRWPGPAPQSRPAAALPPRLTRPSSTPETCRFERCNRQAFIARPIIFLTGDKRCRWEKL